MKNVIRLFTILATLNLGACAGFLPSAGPSYNQIVQQRDNNSANDVAKDVNVVDVSEDVIHRISLSSRYKSFDYGINDWLNSKPALTLDKGDVVQVSIYEAPPAVLLNSSSVINSSDLSIGYGSGLMNLPDQMINQQGTVTIPFAGEVQAIGKTPSQIEQIIRSRLSKIANQPQVVVRVTQNQSHSVTVLGDGRSQRMQLTAKGERLLDAVSLAGDAKKLKSTSIRLTRSGETRFVSLMNLSQNPSYNIFLQSGDIVSVMQDPYRVTVLGATNANTLVDFGDEGLSVSEALGRVAGLNDFRADLRGIFIFRNPSTTRYQELNDYGGDKIDISNQLPTVFRFDLRDVKGMVLAQSFKLQDKDMIYVSNASSVQLQKVLNLFNATLAPVTNVSNAVNAIE